MTQKVWGGRFRKETDTLTNRFNASISFDSRLYAQDIEGSMAHCRMLAKQGIISVEDESAILEALAKILRELDRGEIEFNDDYEDIHSLVEKTLIERVGALGEKLHTGRSRNDQVALDVRMYVRDVIRRVVELIKKTQVAIVDLAEKNIDLIMPGYTHLQRAQPVLVAHHMLAYYEMLKRDLQRFEEALKRTNVLPLGSAALAGSTFNLDRVMVAETLGFDGITANSMDAVSDRDFILDFLYASSVLMMHLSRLCEELVIWSSQEFAFITISDSFCTGSSIMPQKKNPDLPELIRGKTGRVYGHLMSLLTTMKGLPLAYNKDMQEDKEALFDAADTVEICLEVISRLLPEITFNEENLRAATEKGFMAATDLADYLVRKGITFREAHEIVGKMVLFAIDQKKELHNLSLEEMRRFAKKIDKDVEPWLDPFKTVNRRNVLGGTGPEMVKQCLKKAREELAS
ncbi:argininosuccinate lyase [uncultured Desulfobacterium sp.]|uniref:Argininosuccinate lyase n=1 Tax=uncultured Desulfobacterium sp. TaxID=201089 RepID=A0A445MWL1_9BACT|nr:argininosuccinate lyase [uncultured Desulfobacterium sp.]